TFCIVPFTRGREVSKSRDMVVREVTSLVASGVREVTLLGQNVNSYGKDRNREVHFADLLRHVDAIEGLERIRFTTSHPMDCTDELIDCFGELPSLAEYFHLPVQCGSDRVLEAMRRHYTIDHYMGRIERLRQRCPDIALTTDIIVGFPGESDEDFQRTLELLEQVRYQSIFSFKYSERPGTRAAEMHDDVPEPVKRDRLEQVQSLQKRITEDVMNSYAGRTVEVLFEGPSRAMDKGEMGTWQIMGRTRSNLIVNVAIPAGDFWEQRWVGRVAQVRIDEVKQHSFIGSLVNAA
ncbi:MAG: MiaB/RimO family radical SAM methylthiotransferase, partial [Myxococcota bacterium]|nr:MiaB/RimO family radical SAM methylthiotransferase [Myxococcota bacterium]